MNTNKEDRWTKVQKATKGGRSSNRCDTERGNKGRLSNMKTHKERNTTSFFITNFFETCKRVIHNIQRVCDVEEVVIPPKKD